ncbi:MAG: hypothetical protein WC299_01195 [Kiritimatiellia bacterium]
MKYKGWNFEKTLLIRSDSAFDRPGEFIDVYVAVETQSARNLANDVRVVIKPEWNRIGPELPCQVYDIQEHGPVTTFRVAFAADIPANATRRVGILYDNPGAARPRYETDLSDSGAGSDFAAENRHFRARTDPLSGQIDELTIKMQVLEYTHLKRLTPAGRPQEGIRVIFAGKPACPAASCASSWREPETTRIEGPLFCSIARRGKLSPPGEPAAESHPSLEIEYKFFADYPFLLVSSRLEFTADTPVYGIYHDSLAVQESCFSHYCFRPSTPSLPETDLEEAGHILVEPEYTRSLPPGPIFGDFLPYGLPWHAFVSCIRKQDFRFDYALAGIRLEDDSSSPGGPAPAYRAATYLVRDGGQLAWFRAPVYVKKQDCAGNIIMIPRGTIYTAASAWHLGEWDEKKKWLTGIDALGRRFNSKLSITQHPRFLGGQVPDEKRILLPCGNFSRDYEKAGVR